MIKNYYKHRKQIMISELKKNLIHISEKNNFLDID